MRRPALRCDGDRPATGCRFLGLAAIAMVEATVERPGQAARREQRYDLASVPLDARLFAGAVRAHRHSENRLHWVMDVVFRGDRCRLRTGHGPRTLAGVAPLAVHRLRAGSGRPSLEVGRKRAAWNVGYLQRTLRQSP